MTVIEIILWVSLAVCVIVVVWSWIGMLRLEPSTPIYLDERINPIRSIVTTYTFEDGTKIYDTGDGKIEIEHPNQEEKK